MESSPKQNLKKWGKLWVQSIYPILNFQMEKFTKSIVQKYSAFLLQKEFMKT